MFINRKSRKLSKNFVFNESSQAMQIHRHKEIEVISYPTLQYLLGSVLIGVSIYFLYSASGGANGIKGLNQSLWWQFFVALLPMILGLCFIFACQVESLSISRKDDWIVITKTRFFCFVSQQIKRKFSDLIGLSVVRTGKQTNNISMTNYNIVLSFGTCQQVHVLRCMSEGKIIDYFEQVRRIFSHEQISQKRVVVQNLVD